MTISTIDNSQRTAAKVAGWSGVLTFAIVVFGNYVLLNPLIVAGDVAATAQNIAAHQTQLRIAAVCFLTYSFGVVVLLSALYVVLKPVNPGLALVGALFRLVFALLWLLAPLNLLAALRLLGNANYLQAFEPNRLQAMARLHLGANFDAYYVGLPFFGLAATVCAWLWLKSNYIPRGLSIFGVIASAWCVLCFFIFLIFPHFNKIVNDYIFDSPMAIFELIVSFWLLFKITAIYDGYDPAANRGPCITLEYLITNLGIDSDENSYCSWHMFVPSCRVHFCILSAGTKQGDRETRIRRDPQRWTIRTR